MPPHLIRNDSNGVFSMDIIEGLVKALEEGLKRQKDKFLLGMVLLTILLAIVAIARTDVYVTIVLAIVVVVLFLGYLIYLLQMSSARTEHLIQEIASQIIIAIQHEGYIPGHQRRTDFGATLVGKILDAKVERKNRKYIKIMADKFYEAILQL